MDEVDQRHSGSRRCFLGGSGIVAASLLVPLLSGSVRGPRSSPADAPVPAAPRLAVDPSMPRLHPRALAALDTHADRIVHRDRIAIVDFAQASREPRMHLVDLAAGKADSLLVSHGKGSDPSHSGWLQQFSNVPDSNATSRGAYLTAEAYVGQHGPSRRLAGLDPDNSLARARAIVLHGASYVSAAMAAEQGLIGRSQGCFAVAEDAITEVLDRLGPGRLLFAWK